LAEISPLSPLPEPGPVSKQIFWLHSPFIIVLCQGAYGPMIPAGDLFTGFLEFLTSQQSRKYSGQAIRF
jgi:hypothetical protein